MLCHFILSQTICTCMSHCLHLHLEVHAHFASVLFYLVLPYSVFSSLILSFLIYTTLRYLLPRVSSNNYLISLNRTGLWGADAEEMAHNNKSRRKKPICDDSASMYRHDRAFLSALRSADLTAYSYGAPRIGTPNFCKVCIEVSLHMSI